MMPAFGVRVWRLAFGGRRSAFSERVDIVYNEIS
jgi:hypothetical protein